jgi:hypothetical protein
LTRLEDFGTDTRSVGFRTFRPVSIDTGELQNVKQLEADDVDRMEINAIFNGVFCRSEVWIKSFMIKLMYMCAY